MQRFITFMSFLGAVIASMWIAFGLFSGLFYVSDEGYDITSLLLMAGFFIVLGLFVFFLLYRGIISWHKRRGSWERHKEFLSTLPIIIAVSVGIVVGIYTAWWVGLAVAGAGGLLTFLLSKVAK